MLKYLPNLLTSVRLLLALPLGLLILREQYGGALLVGVVAGLSDALDGFAARRLQAFSRLGAMLDPLADKLLVTVSFLSFAGVGLVAWPLAALVIARDLVIVAGAVAYRLLVGPFPFGASVLSKLNMGVQITFCVLLLAGQAIAPVPGSLIAAGSAVVVAAALASGLHYVVTWSLRARRELAGERQA